jgi:hypothetical protein
MLAEVGTDGPSTESLPAGVDVLGIALGVATRADLIRWAPAFGIPCSEGVDASGATVFECRDIDGPVPFVGREHGGEVTRVIAEVRPDDVLRSVSVRRRHATIGLGFADYTATREAMNERLGGPPTVTGEFAIEEGTTEPARQTSAWTTTVIAAELEVLRGMGPALMVTESWTWRPPPQ